MKYRCSVCGYIYDEAVEGVPFADLPDDWRCPVCGEGKEGFELMEEDEDSAPVSKPTPAKPQSVPTVDGWEQEELRMLSAGELSALCSNLARGCDRQQLEAERDMFQELADWFQSRSVVPDDKGIEDILGLIYSDLDKYEPAKAQSVELGDRGALRVLTWSEKVSKIGKSVLERYQKDPHFLDDTNVYVCGVCGFIYIGDEPPEFCPVCKVPGFKFIKIDRRQ